MTHEDAMTKLLRLGPCAEQELQQICGWPAPVFRDTVRNLHAHGVLVLSYAGLRQVRVWSLRP